MDQKTINKELGNFIKKVRLELTPEKIILFGSKARGDDWKRSDYDFIIVSSKFRGMHWLKRISKVVGLWNIPVGIDVLPYTPEEFEDKKKYSSIVRSALKNSRLIAG